MKTKKVKGEIYNVTVISEGEQVAFAGTDIGCFVVSHIPDARFETIYDCHVMKEVNSYDEAIEYYNKRYGINK